MKDDNQNTKVLLDSMVKFDPRGFQHHDVKDISLSGIFIIAKDGTLTKLPANSPVEVALKLRTNGQTKTHLFKAHVTRIQRDGVQLEFNHADVDAYSALLHLDVNKSR